DELHRLSNPQHFPIGDDAIVTQVFAASREPQGGTLTLEGQVSEPAVINLMETSLSDPRHMVIGTGAQSDPRGGDYGWKFKETVVISHPDVAPPAEKPKTESASTG